LKLKRIFRRRRPSGAEEAPPPHAPRAQALSDEEVLRRTEEWNRAAEVYWKDVLGEASARRHVLNKPFASVTDAPSMLYRLGLALSELRLGLGHVVLDFGAGSCWLSSCLNRLGCRTIAVDVSPAALEMGRELFRVDPRQRPELEPRFLPYDGHRLPLPAESVDRIACFDAFHHVPNPEELLAEFHRVLRPGGRAVLAEPGEGHSHSELSCFETERCGVLESEVDIPGLQRRALRAGFTAVRLKPYPDPDAMSLDAAEYVRLMDGEGRLLPMAALQRSLRNFFVITLLKGDEVRDSRQPGRLRASIEWRGAEGPLRGEAGALLPLPLRIRNDGDTLWRHELDPAGGYVMVSGHLADAEGRTVRSGFFRTALPRPVAPGDAVDLLAEAPLPGEGGRYRLRIDLVDEHVMWFSQAGSKVLERELEVEGGAEAGALLARLEAEGPLRAAGGTRMPFSVRLTNLGTETWGHAPEPRPGTVSLAGHVMDAEGQMHTRDHLHQPLPRSVAAGETVEMTASVRAPLEPGSYRLKLDLVKEHVCWFEQRGSVPLELGLTVSADVPDSANPGLLRATLELHRPTLPVRARGGSLIPVSLRATNIGNTTWLRAAADVGQVLLGAHLLDGQRRLLVLDYARTPLPRDVAPLQAVELEAALAAPLPPGRYMIELDLVDEGVAWFGALGSPTVGFELEVPPLEE
jgi:SAM-dependent methyltransferase